MHGAAIRNAVVAPATAAIAAIARDGRTPEVSAAASSGSRIERPPGYFIAAARPAAAPAHAKSTAR